MSKQIARLTAGETVTLKFQTRGEPQFEEAVFLGLSEDGQTASFHSTPADTRVAAYDWDAYRFQGRWCYGSSAQRVGVA